MCGEKIPRSADVTVRIMTAPASGMGWYKYTCRWGYLQVLFGEAKHVQCPCAERLEASAQGTTARQTHWKDLETTPIS